MASMDTDEVNPYQLLARLWQAKIFIGTVALLCGLAAAGWVYHWAGTTKLSLMLEIGNLPTALGPTEPIEPPAELAGKIDAFYSTQAKNTILDLSETRLRLRSKVVDFTDFVRIVATCPPELADPCERWLKTVAELIRKDHREEVDLAQATVRDDLAREIDLLKTLKQALKLQTEAMESMQNYLSIDIGRHDDQSFDFTRAPLHGRMIELLQQTSSYLPQQIILGEYRIASLKRSLNSLHETKSLLLERSEQQSGGLVVMGAAIVAGLVLGCLVTFYRDGYRAWQQIAENGEKVPGP